ncbi:MAG: hypothetical protein QOJ52_2282 [Acidimicrobiaceae bacterium]|nr:hypothetical protein [Acidimicrobiaceae bacterium]
MTPSTRRGRSPRIARIHARDVVPALTHRTSTTRPRVPPLAKGGSIAVLETGGVVVGDRVDIYLEIEAVLNA